VASAVNVMPRIGSMRTPKRSTIQPAIGAPIPLITRVRL
jgi:hypothetical protein